MIKLAITATKEDGTPDLNRLYWFAGDPLKTVSEHSPIADERRDISRKSSTESGIEWPYVIPHDAGNEQLTMSFRTTRLFDSIAACWRWRNSFSSATPANWPHPIEGDCIMRFELEDGSIEEVRLHDCLLKKPSMLPEGKTLELGYTLQGGRIETLATSIETQPLAEGADFILLKLFATPLDGKWTDAATETGSAASLPAGTQITIQGVDNISSTTVTKSIELVAVGGTPSPGFTAVVVPFADNLAAIVSEFAGETHLTAELVSEARPYIALAWKTAPAGAADEVRITVTIVGLYEGTTTADDYESEVLPTDDAGDIPTAPLDL